VQAIDEQYLPDVAGGPLPRSRAGALLAAADKLDTLTIAFGLGKRPTGSRDPFGLRRAAIGLCRLATEGGVRVERKLLPDDVRDFVEERLEGLLRVPVEFVRAARASAAADVGGVARLAEGLYNAERSQEFAAVYEAYDRAHRLAGRRDDAAAVIDESRFEHDTERELAAAVAALELDPADVAGSLARAAAVAPIVARFFDDVMVIAEDEQVRGNRLRLLLDLRDRLQRLGDLSQIPR
jgi:glycyl-tRNA synthetase beta chain